MTEPREGRRRTAVRRAELTDRQREVLRLIAARKTNGEIAEALGISLDGAKYHVREICDRIGVDTREEAAEWWRQQNGLGARLRLVTRWSALPAAFRWAGGAAGAIAVAGIALFLVFVDGDAESREAALWVAMIEPVALTEEAVFPPPSNIRLVHAGGVVDRIIAVHQPLVLLALSPDATRIVAPVWESRAADAAAPADETVTLLILDAISGDHREVAFPAENQAMISQPVWSPDSQLFAIATDRFTVVSSRDGREVGRFDASLEEGTPSAAVTPMWSSDSRWLAAGASDRVVVIEPDGTVVAEASHGELAAMAHLDEDASIGLVFPDYWDEDGRVVFVAGYHEGDDFGGYLRFRGHLENASIDWTLENGDLPPFYRGGLPSDWVEQFDMPFDDYQPLFARATHQGPVGSLVSWREEDGNGLDPGSEEEEADRLSLVVEVGGELHRIDIAERVDGFLLRNFLAQHWWDAVTVEDSVQ